MTIGQRIKARREAIAMSQVALADLIGEKKQTLYKYESGIITNIPIDKIESIAKALSTTPAYLMGWEDDPMDPVPPEESTRGKTQEQRAELYAWKHRGAREAIEKLDLPEDALKLAKDYTALDQPGKNVVKVVVAEEGKRVQAEKERRKIEPAEPSDTRYIPLYYTPAAAGLMQPAEGQDYDYIEVGLDVPRKADCAVKIDGDSMEPYIRNGSIVYVTREPLENGDVGIFCVDGDMICKQYYIDEWGNVRLLSLNRKRSDADRFIHHKDSDTIMTYYGRVILPVKPKICL